MAKYYSPEGNPEVWDVKPEVYYTEDKWKEMHPPAPPTKEEQIAALDAQYDMDKAELVKYYGEAGLMGDTDLQAELRGEMEDIDAEYAKARKEIEEGSEE